MDDTSTTYRYPLNLKSTFNSNPTEVEVSKFQSHELQKNKTRDELNNDRLIRNFDILVCFFGSQEVFPLQI